MTTPTPFAFSSPTPDAASSPSPDAAAAPLTIHVPTDGAGAHTTSPAAAADGLAPPTKPPPPEVSDVDAPNAPRMSPLAVLWLFLKFGMRAFGGPVVQINDQREELVVKGKWISERRFARVFAVYAVLPGPEATELACYFGRLAGGRVGGLMGGLGFILPGFALTLLGAWFYVSYGTSNSVFKAVLGGLQPAMAALVFRACHKIADGAFRDHATKEWDWGLALVGALGAFESVLTVNFFIAKAHLIAVYYVWLLAHGEGRGSAKGGHGPVISAAWGVALAVTILAPIAVFIGVIAAYGRMDTLIPMGVGVGASLGNTPAAQFVVGLLGGLVTFGGAYTAIPFINYETVTSGAWIAPQVFLDALAIGSILPTPLVMFVVVVGYAAGFNAGGQGALGPAFAGAALMALGMFLPAFVMPIFFHEHLESLVMAHGTFARILDSVAATVVGQIAVTALQLLRSSVVNPLGAVIFFGAIQTAYNLPHKYTPILIVAAAAAAGQVLFNPNAE